MRRVRPAVRTIHSLPRRTLKMASSQTRTTIRAEYGAQVNELPYVSIAMTASLSASRKSITCVAYATFLSGTRYRIEFVLVLAMVDLKPAGYDASGSRRFASEANVRNGWRYS